MADRAIGRGAGGDWTMDASSLTSRVAGPGAAAVKYDTLTALTLMGMHGPSAMQGHVLKLIAVVTARYDWRRDELCVCQRDMARLFGVTERTVKRVVRAWVEARLMIRTRAGVRGRAGAFRLDRVEIARASEPHWSCVGPDFVERMGAALRPAASVAEQGAGQGNAPGPDRVVHVDFHGAGRRAGAQDAEDAPGGDADRSGSGAGWRAAARRLALVDPAMHAAWIAPLTQQGAADRHLTLRAPSRFAAHYVSTRLMAHLAEAVEAEMGPGWRISVES